LGATAGRFVGVTNNQKSANHPELTSRSGTKCQILTTRSRRLTDPDAAATTAGEVTGDFASGCPKTAPLFAFAGIWCTWHGRRGTQKNPVDGEHTLYGFLTTAPNDVVRPVHSKVMPVILTEPAEFDAWLDSDVESALKLQRPLPADRLQIVALDQREGDGVAAPPGQLALESP
jgi:hypothetical protein